MTVDYTQPPAAPPPPPPPPGQPGAPQKSSGCWKWGCGGCVVVILVCCAALAVCVFVIFSFIKGSDVYRGAREKVVNDPRVISAVGTPMKDGYWVSGKVNVSGQGGEADFKFPISGPKDSATVHAVATRDQNGWTYTDLTVMPSHGSPIEVLKP